MNNALEGLSPRFAGRQDRNQSLEFLESSPPSQKVKYVDNQHLKKARICLCSRYVLFHEFFQSAEHNAKICLSNTAPGRQESLQVFASFSLYPNNLTVLLEVNASGSLCSFYERCQDRLLSLMHAL